MTPDQKPLTPITRYDDTGDRRRIVEHPHGRYVLYTEHERQLSEMRRERDEANERAEQELERRIEAEDLTQQAEQSLAQARAQVVEECVQACEQRFSDPAWCAEVRMAAGACVTAIRSLSPSLPADEGPAGVADMEELFRPADEGWVACSEHKPDEGRQLLVTNNLSARDSFGEMSHLWLVFCLHGPDQDGEFSAFDGVDNRVRGVTHWRYALPPAPSDRA